MIEGMGPRYANAHAVQTLAGALREELDAGADICVHPAA
jgi:hypothetical protein